MKKNEMLISLLSGAQRLMGKRLSFLHILLDVWQLKIN